MRFSIAQEVLEKFPEVKIALVVAKGIDNAKVSDELLSELRSVENEIKQKLKLETLTTHPKIVDWRNAYSFFGAKPKTFKNSVESLLRRVLKHGELPTINAIVNTYNMMSIKHILPAGGDDLDKVDGNITLTIAKGGEPFTLLGGASTEQAEKGEVIYRDDKEVVCRRWNWRECDKTKMTEETKNVCLVIESLQSTTKEELLIAMNELKEKVMEYVGGEITTHVLDKNNPSAIL